MTEDERMRDVISRDATMIGRITNAAIDMGRGIVGKPSIWHEVREWELRQEAAFACSIEDVLESEVAAARPAPLSATQVADHLTAEMALAPERAAAVLALEELAIRMEVADGEPLPYGAVFRPELYDYDAKGNPIHKVDRTAGVGR